MNEKNKIPVTIITGFLGAGKTTFINQLLRANPHIQFALVENEFGEVAIDTQLIKGVDASQMFELKQGCICCTISDEYELVLEELAERFPHVQHLLIETTGIADPTPVIQPLFRDENLARLYEYNGTVCLVDALHFSEIPEKDISFKQLVVSDYVLVNKSEKLDLNRKQEFEDTILKYAPLANVEFVTHGNAKEFSLSKLQKDKSEVIFLDYVSAHTHLKSKTLCFSQPLNKDEFLHWLEYTLDIYKNQIYRTKGIVYFQNEPFEYIIQGVGGNFEIIEGDLVMENPESKIVFIGDLEHVDLQYSSN